jgi:soluble lytic murein transglycosylase
MNVLRSDTMPVARRGIRVWLGLLLAALAVALVAFAAFWPRVGGMPRLRRAYRCLRANPARYDAIIQETARRHGVSPAFVKAVIWTESRFVPDTVGGKGEAGLMQVTEGAVLEWAEAHGRPLPARQLWFDPQLNIEIGTWYLARAMNRWREYESMEVLALSEYNAGRSRALKWAPEDPRDEVPPEEVIFPSTRAYITQILAKTRHYEQTEASE